uniref:Fatty acid binding protein 5 n=2 Tax=Canis lupus familiaris TaxID=9615 RepID=A0A8P0PKF8_CANLF
MATIQQLVGRWRLVESKGFDEYMKEVGVGMALRKVGAMAKPDCIISSDGKNLTIKTESTLKTTQFSCNLGEKFEETTADGRKTQIKKCIFADCLQLHRRRIGSTSGMGWEGKHNNKKVGRWEIGGGKCQIFYVLLGFLFTFRVHVTV